MLSGFDLDSILGGLMRRRIVTLILSVTVLLTALSYLSGFSNLLTEISVLNLIMGELAFAFLSISFTFPAVENKKVIKLSAEFLIIVAVFFMILVFIPIGEGTSVLTFKKTSQLAANSSTAYDPTSVTINAFILLIVNLLVFAVIYTKEKLNLNLDYIEPETDLSSFKKTDFSDLIAEVPKEKIIEEKQLTKSRRMALELKEEVNEIFDVYLDQFSDKAYTNTNEKLSTLEEALLKYINPDVTAALCLDDDFKSLEKSLFFWDESNKEELIAVFKQSNQASTAIGAGKVCQALVSSAFSWYLIAEFKGNYLILKSRTKDFSPLLDTAHKVFKHISLK